jgi:peptidoglycan hydrolase-like protein with peptidoglycan-binding domain
MKNMKKILALALVVMSVMAIALPAMAEVWSNRYGDAELYSNTPGDVDAYVRNVQRDLNKYFQNYPSYQITVDGYYGQDTKAAVRRFQGYMGLSVDGRTGNQTKTKLWDVYQGTITPLP